jgi:hypothetical protein
MGVEAAWVNPATAQAVEDQLVRGRVADRLNGISCHANRLQGLTDEWRAQWDPDHQDCWRSKCPSFNPPPDGFTLSRWAPPLREAMLRKYQTASDLFGCISVAMPYQEPGILDDEKYWDIEAYLLRVNGLRWGDQPLGPEDASALRMSDAATVDADAVLARPAPEETATVAPAFPAPVDESRGSGRLALLVAGAIGLLAIGAGFVRWRTRPGS